jgi:hypothetical protein
MIDFNAARLVRMAVHLVGNKSNEEGIRLSGGELEVGNEDTMAFLKQYFLSPFNKLDESFHLQHVSGIEFNEVYTFCSRIFDDPDSLYEHSVEIAKHLYEMSTHPKVKPGELSVVFFEGVNFEGLDRRAIGIFKSENKNVFLQFERDADSYAVQHTTGVDVEKLEKGALIYEMEKEEGYRLSIIDPLKSGDAQYWKNEFLNVRSCSDSFNQTKQFLTVTKEFITQQFAEDFNVSKTDQIDLLNRSVEYFKTHENFDKQEFEQEVFYHENVIDSFRKFDEEKRRENNYEIEDSFDISKHAVKKQARIFKSVLKLDKNFHIYIHGNRELIEQGVDEDGRKFYKIYYNQET